MRLIGDSRFDFTRRCSARFVRLLTDRTLAFNNAKVSGDLTDEAHVIAIAVLGFTVKLMVITAALIRDLAVLLLMFSCKVSLLVARVASIRLLELLFHLKCLHTSKNVLILLSEL